MAGCFVCVSSHPISKPDIFSSQPHPHKPTPNICPPRPSAPRSAPDGLQGKESQKRDRSTLLLSIHFLSHRVDLRDATSLCYKHEQVFKPPINNTYVLLMRTDGAVSNDSST